MPEGPELHLSSRFVNASCKGRVFGGKVIKSPVHKSCEVPFESEAYTITATSRGKEMQLILCKLNNSESKSDVKKSKLKIKTDPDARTKILFRFGMSGKFEFTTEKDIHKHSHLRFFTNDNKPPMVLSHVDVRRFGRWEVDADWSKDRGPDPMFQYSDFRSNVLTNLDKSAFNQPICEVLLNQKYFNGIGNYLRAEILYRLSIPPFEKAHTVLQGLRIEPPDCKPGKGAKKGREAADMLHLCHTVPLEVINIGGGGYDPEGNKTDYTSFSKWLQCYYQDGMNNMVDHNKRTIWFKGPAGPMVPKEGKSRSKKTKKRKGASNNKPDPSTEITEDTSPPKKVKATPKSTKSTSQKAKKTVKEKNPVGKSSKTKKSSTKELQTPSRSRRKSANSDVISNGAKKSSRQSGQKKGTAAKKTRVPKKIGAQPKKRASRRKTSKP